MKHCNFSMVTVSSFSFLFIFTLTGMTTVQAVGISPINAEKARVIEYWTAQRRAAAIPRDLVIDPRGLGYLRLRDGSLQPYGHRIAAEAKDGILAPMARPIGNDSTSPSITNMAPAQDDVIGSSHTFSATITDASGIKSVNFVIQYPNGTTSSPFNANKENGSDTWSLTIQGFTDSTLWAWWVVAKDGASKGGNTATSPTVGFSVDTSGSSSGGSTNTDTVINALWTSGGAIQTAAGRLYFEMPGNSKWKGIWQGYVCSGTVVQDDTAGRSTILTAAHCVYDDVNKAFARNVMFIPDQADTTGTGTDLNCNNDPLGCWIPSFGVVDSDWTTRTFPNNREWDYGFYAVDDNGAHAGPAPNGSILDSAAGTLSISFITPYANDGVDGAGSVDYTHALGYSYSEDPNLMYCAEDMTTNGQVNWWLPSSELSGGSSGGPWVQPMDPGQGSGPVISVNSWGYTSAPGMAGPKLPAAECVFTIAKSTPWSSVSSTDGKAGVSVSCP